ncbi:Aste57867_25408 [Aphanomyces stellatus]|uniref:Aste57867_25408 protein n=1 Tax=Aphanomyces stellatus TaxID=120398 RepID=A0A485LT34_9STRA|nr:hypothetical protein As57867_025329 [Aphanomyces stellatus]VFU02032.1 Aste57867_25408 [Aphanomyces stellatus]
MDSFHVGHDSDDGGLPRMGSSSVWANIKMAYQSLVHTVIRPPRSRYAVDDLGPTTCIFAHNLLVGREDFTLRNDKGLAVECSWWKPKQNPHQQTATPTKMPCIIVLHGNSSSRLGCMEILFHGLAAGFTVCAIDFSGSGLSEGKYVSLGYHEKKDIQLVLTHLLASGDVSNIILWGRSMGAVASILCAADVKKHITAMVLDSPFASLKQLALDLVDEGKLNVPKVGRSFAVSVVMRFLRRDILRRAKFDMFHLKPKAVIRQCPVPAFFAIGDQDELVSPKHVRLLHDRHQGPKELFTFPGGHNSIRPPAFFHKAVNFCRVMCGLLPMAPSSDKSVMPVQVHSPTTGLTSDEMRGMSVRDLKQMLRRVGIDDDMLATLVEKSELVALAIKLRARHVRMRIDSDVDKHAPPPSPRTASSVAAPSEGIHTSTPTLRRHSTGSDVPPICLDDIVPHPHHES